MTAAGVHDLGRGVCRQIEMADGAVSYCAGAFESRLADRWFSVLHSDIAWKEEHIVIFGEHRKVPRLVAWYGDPGASYVYSGVRHEPLPWIPPLEEIRERVERLTGHAFNSVLANLYRDGNDGMGWHADDEAELGRDPVIASVSLGATRRFRMRHRRLRDLTVDLDLEHGSLLVMAGATQHHWVHAVPKTRRPVGERINLTFRRILPIGA